MLETYAKHFLTKGGNMKLGKTLDIQQKTIIKLLERTDYSFVELKNKLNISEEILYKKLKELIKLGIVVNYYMRKEGADEYSYYQLTLYYKNNRREFK